MGMSVSEYAKHRGVSHVAVLKAIKVGRIIKDPDGTIDQKKADKSWDANTNPAYQRAKQASTVCKVDHDRKEIPDYQTSRAEREYYLAQMSQLEYEQQKKTLVNRKDVDDEIFSEYRRVRDRMQNIPSIVSPKLASMTDLREIEIFLEKEIAEALEELSQ
ncbi:MAG: hypothetical protein HQL95_01775 [Magnetococcales bacterium]|nr:hypothetical protein [Magnetococcales bacterium]